MASFPQTPPLTSTLSRGTTIEDNTAPVQATLVSECVESVPVTTWTTSRVGTELLDDVSYTAVFRQWHAADVTEKQYLLETLVDNEIERQIINALSKDTTYFRSRDILVQTSAPGVNEPFPRITYQETEFFYNSYVIDFGNSQIKCVFTLNGDFYDNDPHSVFVCTRENLLLYPSDNDAISRLKAAENMSEAIKDLEKCHDVFVFSKLCEQPNNQDRPLYFPPIGDHGRQLLLAIRHIPDRDIIKVGVDGLMYIIDLDTGKWCIDPDTTNFEVCYQLQSCFIKSILGHLMITDYPNSESFSCDIDLDMLLKHHDARINIRT